jgi:Na+/H+ antiporter NhaC
MNFDYGSMNLAELNHMAQITQKKKKDAASLTGAEDQPHPPISQNGKVIHLVLPIASLIVCCVIGMIYTGGFFSGESFIDAFSNSDASVGLVYGSVVALIITILFFLATKVLSFSECMNAIPEGFKIMVPAILVLTFAWTLKSMTDSLGAAEYVAGIVANVADNRALMGLLPALVFVVGIFLAFATGTSWGTFGILIPIVVNVFGGDLNNELMIIAISACMAGAVCGDHCSPISDTTIMASAGAECDHIRHVSTQLPYAITVAAVSLASYIVSGFVRNWFISLVVGIILMVGTLFVIKNISAKKVNS